MTCAAPTVVGWYVHDHGSGHRTRAALVAAELRAAGARVHLLSAAALDDPDATLLPPDGDPPTTAETAGGALHWAPLRHRGLLARGELLVATLAGLRPDVVVVDASVEVALQARTLGLPVVVVGAPGDRRDLPHELAYRAAELVLAPWPAWADPLRAPAGSARVVAVGGFSRFDGRTAEGVAVRPGHAVVLLGHGGVDDGHPTAVDGWTVDVLDGDRDPWAALLAADVVVCHAGQNAVAEVAAARRPAVVVAQRRPFGEQAATARVLDAAGIAVGCDGWPEPQQWQALLDRARSLGGDGWARWSDGGGARRAAREILEVAGG